MKHNWIKESIKKPGILRQYAKRNGVIKNDEPIPVEWLREQAKRNDAIGRRARLALTLRRMRNG
jgi:hypothetical protein